MNAFHKSTLLESYKELGVALGVYQPTENVSDIIGIKFALEDTQGLRWLLIFDRADDPQFNTEIEQHWVPKKNGDYIFTSIVKIPNWNGNLIDL